MKLRNLDVLRACLALMVLVGHARMLLWMGWQDWKVLPHAWWEMVVSVFFAAFRFGHQAVMVFFAMSGFFIHLRAAQALVEGNSVKLSSFGTFLVRSKRERMGRNPKTGEEVPITPRRVLVFRPSQVMKNIINGHEPGTDDET